MKFRIKIALAAVILISLVFGAGAGALLFTSFRTSLDREKEAALTAYRTVADALSLTEAADRTAAPAIRGGICPCGLDFPRIRCYNSLDAVRPFGLQ